MRSLHNSIGLGAVIVTALLTAVPANAKTVLDPGMWQDTETGTEDGKPVKAKVTTDCMSEKDAEDPAKSLSDMKATAGQQCSKMDVHQTANGFSMAMRCGDPKQFYMDIDATYTIHDRRHYSGHMKTTVVFGGHKSSTDKQIESKWVGASCKK